MITEIARLTIDPARASDFEAAVASAVGAFRNAKGCHAMSLEREIEDPARYRLLVRWESVESHMVDFRNSEDFQVWRSAAGPFFVEPPVVIHSAEVERYF